MGIKRTWSIAVTPCPFQQCQPQLPWVFLQVCWGQGEVMRHILAESEDME